MQDLGRTGASEGSIKNGQGGHLVRYRGPLAEDTATNKENASLWWRALTVGGEKCVDRTLKAIDGKRFGWRISLCSFIRGLRVSHKADNGG